MPLGIHTLHEHARFQRPLRIAKLKVIMEDIVDAMECLDKHHIVHCDLKPGNVMLFREHNQVERWKLIDFDSSAVVGDAVDRGTLEYCAPEVIAANATRQPIQAAHSMDMYALGRILLWLSSDSEHLWPDCSEHASDQDKQAFLQSESEFTITEQLVSHAPTRHVVVSLLRKNPMERMTLERLRASSFVQMNLDTRVLAI
jgi:serine/threonine protein kinase